MDLSYSKSHVDTFVIISGDSDFSPLVSKLKENGKQVIGIGMKSSTSDLLVDNCDEFIFYEDLDRPALSAQTYDTGSIPAEKRKLFDLVMDALVALRRENKEVIWSSMVKDTIKRKRPQFNESYYGYRSFSNVLEDGQRFGLLSLTTDPRSGTYVVSEAGRGQAIPTAPPNGAPSGRPRDDNGGREDRWGRRRGRRGGRGDGRGEGRADGRRSAWGNGGEGQPEGDDAGRSQETPAYGASSAGEGEGAPVVDATIRPMHDERDEYGFSHHDSGAADIPEAREYEEQVGIQEPLPLEVAPDSDGAELDDDRTPEERELDARAEALAQSRPSTDSPSRTGRGTGTGRGRAAAGTGRGRRAAAAPETAAPAARRGRPAATGTGRTGGSGRTRGTGRSGGATRTRTTRKSG
jgi:hypothetical protein